MGYNERRYEYENHQGQQSRHERNPQDHIAAPDQIHPRAARLLDALKNTGEYGGIDYAQLEASRRDRGEKELAKLAVDEVRDEVSTDTLVRVGSPSRAIVETARSLPADLIVISTHGGTGMKHVFLGSVAEHVVQRAPCPVFVVREREHECV